MVDLLDVNVWLALNVPDHVHHKRSLKYWREEAGTRVISCRTTELALLRLLTSAHAVGSGALHGAAAWSIAEEWRSRGVAVEAEPTGVDDLLQAWAGMLDLRGRLWTDAYLAAFAVAGGYRLVSFDSDFHRFPHLHWLHLA